ncbi:hypothetical protein PHYPSEUDO_002624 [Phytophthora pseudosyringae]|uniref:Uncharacterized protein n=1 Tax=Phytophthora pseudosyringae TaxID=221518 RepID=A0A8T1VU18_9STRA|nr:hypothetical protein PHYPSEUDO_002624 [Phytophthora pseudosyringae]
MLNPKRSLAIDAPPIAPYDDGFSTDSEDFNDQEHTPHEPPASLLFNAALGSVKSAAVAENQSNLQRQQIQDGTPTNAVKQASEHKPQSISAATTKTEENASKQGVDGRKAPRNGQLKPQVELHVAAALRTGEKKIEGHCRSCKGYLTPLDERLKVMKTAALQQFGKGPPPSRQCCCCHITYPFVALTDESRNRACLQPRCYMCNWSVRSAKKKEEMGVIGAKRTVDGAVKDAGLMRERCRSCRGKLNPLGTRLKMMNKAGLHHKGPGPPSSRQCFCCQITYPSVALTTRSREPTCTKQVCETCELASAPPGVKAQAARHGTTETLKLRNGSPTPTEKTGAAAKRDLESGDKEYGKASATVTICCRSCKGKLPTLADRLRVMNSAAVQLKKQGRRVSPPTRQCSCCYITFPLASLSVKSKSIMCAKPICNTCSGARAHTLTTEETSPSSSTVATNNSAEMKRETLPAVMKTPEIIVIDGGEDEDDEEGELVEEHICKCCIGKLLSLEKKLQMMKDAAQQHSEKGPPPSRQCACCRISYPSAALTKKSRKMTRVVPICLNCCKAGGSAIYEMLAVSDEFIEAFKVENPEMARQLITKKANGSMAGGVENQRKRMMKTTPAQPLKKKEAPNAQLKNAQLKNTQLKSTQLLREFAPRPVYRWQPMTARKCIDAPRLVIRDSANGSSQVHKKGLKCKHPQMLHG